MATGTSRRGGQRGRARGESTTPGPQEEFEVQQDTIDILDERGLEYQASMNGVRVRQYVLSINP